MILLQMAWVAIEVQRLSVVWIIVASFEHSGPETYPLG